MRRSDTGDLWWKNAVFYCADVETFYDWNGDGTGDIRGMTERIEYLFDLGVTCLWLMPFYPTARKDDGYDITDFFGVDPRLGTHGDFVELVRTARASGIRVIIDFVMNHTSDGHPWFKSARRSKDDPYRDYYVWSATEPKSSPKDVVFPDQENSIWELDPKTNEWYLHHFYKHQPDLNIANPKVQEEISRTLGFWLELGVSGFRVDAVPFLFARDAAPGTPGVFDPNQYLGDVRNFVTRRVGDAVLLGEVNLPYKDQKTFFGGPDGDGLNMQFDFIGMQNIYLSLARGDARPIAKALRQRPQLDVTSQWANFVRNHDELTLDKLSEDERQEVFDAFGPDPDMQLYGRGLRRRLPSMLGGDERRMRMAYSLMFSLPGTPVLFYGEEIGMAENLDIPGRLAVRTPMQWTGGANGGFSKAAKRRLTRPLPDGLYGPKRVNAADQRHDHESFWWFIRDLIYTYRQQPEIGWSTVEILKQPNPAVLAHVCREESGWAMVALHNFGADSCIVPVQLEDVPPGSHPRRPARRALGARARRPWPGRARPRGLRLPMAAPAATGGRADHLSRPVNSRGRSLIRTHFCSSRSATATAISLSRLTAACSTERVPPAHPPRHPRPVAALIQHHAGADDRGTDEHAEHGQRGKNRRHYGSHTRKRAARTKPRVARDSTSLSRTPYAAWRFEHRTGFRSRPQVYGGLGWGGFCWRGVVASDGICPRFRAGGICAKRSRVVAGGGVRRRAG